MDPLWGRGVQLRDSMKFVLSLQAGLWDAPPHLDHSPSVLLPLHTLLLQPQGKTFSPPQRPWAGIWLGGILLISRIF